MDGWLLLDEVNVLAKLPGNFNELLESKKWTERRDALQALLNELSKTPRLDPSLNYNDITSNLRNVLVKDSNINVCALAAKCITGLAYGLRTKFGSYASSFVPIVFERFKEKKPLLRDPLIDCIDMITTTVNLEVLIEDLLSSVDKPNPNIKLQGCNFFYRLMKKYSQTNAPKKVIKAVSPLLVKLTTDPDADVREAACTAVGSVMRLTGEKVMNSFLGQIQEDKVKMKKICDGRDKAVAEVAEEEMKRCEMTGEKVEEVVSAGATQSTVTSRSEPAVSEVDPWDLLDAVDILPKLPGNFLEGIESKKWQERRDALQAFLSLATDNPKLCPKANYGEYVTFMKKILEKDANINVCALAARCITALANGLRKKFSVHASLVTPVILEKFKEKKPVLRDPLIDCIDAVFASTMLESLADDVLAALEKQNPNIKIQTNLFLYRFFKKHNAQTIPKKVLKLLAPIIVKHTGDSDPEVRDASYAALGAAMKAVGEKPCLVLLSDIVEDKVKMGKIKDFCEKARQEAGPDIVSVMVQSIHKSNLADTKHSVVDEREPLKPPAPGVGNKHSSPPSVSKKPVEDPEVDEKSQNTNEVNGESKVVEKESVKDQILQINKEKSQRLRDEKNLKLLKWNFDQPTSEHLEQLRNLMNNVTQPALFSMLFHKDFKQHLKAIDILQNLILENPESILSNSDLLLKWISLRFFETNPTVLLKALDFASAIFTIILQTEEAFSDAELFSFVPYLILKLGEAKESVRAPVRTILNLITEIVSPIKIFQLVLEGLKTKNSRQRTECLQFLEHLLGSSGLASTSNPAQSLKLIAVCIGDRDTNVRNAAINAIVAAWKEEGDRVFQMIGKMSDKEKVMLDERIKRSGFVPKPKGLSEKTGNKNGDRPNIAIGIKGRGTSSSRRRDRSSSRVSDSRSPPPSRDASPSNGRQLNRTYIKDDENGQSTVRKRFALDMKLLVFDDDRPPLNYAGVDSNKLAILEPLEPVVRLRAQNTSFAHRAESVSSITSLESSSCEVDKVVNAVSSVSRATANAAISQLHFLFDDSSSCHFVTDRINTVIQSIVMQLSLVRSRHLSDIAVIDEVNELIRTICNFLSSLVKEPAICSRISSEALKMIIQEFLYLLKDERTSQLKDSHWIGRSINFLSIKICDNADATACFLALCSMLASALRDPRCVIVDLVNKCIYKQTESFLRNVPLSFDLILKAIHDFLEEFKIRKEGNEQIRTGLHTMELCIQRLVSGTKSAIIEHTRYIPNPETSEAVIYIRKCIRKLENGGTASMTSSMVGEIPGQVMTSAAEESVRQLVEKIIEEPYGKGIRHLFTYLKMNAEGKKYLDSVLKKAGLKKDFIIFHLKKMENSESDVPEISSELKEVLSNIERIKENVKSILEGNTSNSLSKFETINAPKSDMKQTRRSFLKSDTDVSQGGPENIGLQVATQKRNLKSSDVEKLKQHLNKLKQNQVTDDV